MRCLEVAQAATKTPATAAPETIVAWAGKFEAFVVGPDEAAPAPKPTRLKAVKTDEATP